MWYIYKENGEIAYQRDIHPKTNEIIEIERMPPIPVRDGYKSVLNANFSTGEVWYDLKRIPLTIEEERDVKIEQVLEYDRSDNVNIFQIGTTLLWLDKSTRAGLKLRFDAEKASGITTTSLWYQSQQITLPIDTAIAMLLQVELYASACYDVTQQHIANVTAIENIEKIKEYNHTTSYPEKLTFTP